MSLPPREAWIEMWRYARQAHLAPSLPPREAWIEIKSIVFPERPAGSLPPREAWIEMCHPSMMSKELSSRFPHGKRGLK